MQFQRKENIDLISHDHDLFKIEYEESNKLKPDFYTDEQVV